MCMTDWRIGRLVRSVTTQFSLPQLTQANVVQNMQRIGWDLSPNSPMTFQVDSLGPSIGLARVVVNGKNTFLITQTSLEISVRLTTHGDLPTKPFVISNFDADNAFNLTEYFMPEEYLEAGLNSFNSEYAQWLKLHSQPSRK